MMLRSKNDALTNPYQAVKMAEECDSSHTKGYTTTGVVFFVWLIFFAQKGGERL
jgi:hypothetical protein